MNIEYIGLFTEKEKTDIKQYLLYEGMENNIIIRNTPYQPIPSIETLNIAIEARYKYEEVATYFYNEEYIQRILCPGTLISNALEDISLDSSAFRTNDCMVFVNSKCSEKNCLCFAKGQEEFSVTYNKVKEQIQNLSQRKYIIFAGINVIEYFEDNLDIIGLCKQILLDFPEIEKLVLTSVSPFNTKLEELLQYIQTEKRILPLLPLCLNSGSRRIVELQGHIYNEDYLRVLKSTNIQFLPYITIGFPTETKEEFQETLDLISELKDNILGILITLFVPNQVGVWDLQNLDTIKVKWNIIQNFLKETLNKDLKFDIDRKTLFNIIQSYFGNGENIKKYGHPDQTDRIN